SKRFEVSLSGRAITHGSVPDRSVTDHSGDMGNTSTSHSRSPGAPAGKTDPRVTPPMLERLELKVPPLVLVAVTSVAMWLSAVALPCLSASHPYRLPVAGAILFAGLGIIGL